VFIWNLDRGSILTGDCFWWIKWKSNKFGYKISERW